MFDILRTYLETEGKLTDEQFGKIKSFFIPRKLKKGEFLQHAGDVPKYGAFVAKGCLRSYIIDAKGKDHIIQFVPENWWISDVNSARNQVPSPYFFEAIENSEVLLIDLPSFTKLMATVPEFASHYHSGLQKNSAAKDKRIVANLSSTAEERYQEFLSTYPSIALRVPQHMLASYLGISPETLSRIRKRWV